MTTHSLYFQLSARHRRRAIPLRHMPFHRHMLELRVSRVAWKLGFNRRRAQFFAYYDQGAYLPSCYAQASHVADGSFSLYRSRTPCHQENLNLRVELRSTCGERMRRASRTGARVRAHGVHRSSLPRIRARSWAILRPV